MDIRQQLAELLMGGNKFGGNTFGGNTFGGNKFGASAAPQSVTVAATPPALPAFDLYNDSLPPVNDYMARQPNLPAGGSPPAPGGAPAAGPMPAQAPMLAPDMPAMPPPQQVGPQGPTPEALALAQALQQRKLLPEQWAGAFSNQYGEPG